MFLPASRRRRWKKDEKDGGYFCPCCGDKMDRSKTKCDDNFHPELHCPICGFEIFESLITGSKELISDGIKKYLETLNRLVIVGEEAASKLQKISRYAEQ